MIKDEQALKRLTIELENCKLEKSQLLSKVSLYEVKLKEYDLVSKRNEELES